MGAPIGFGLVFNATNVREVVGAPCYHSVDVDTIFWIQCEGGAVLMLQTVVNRSPVCSIYFEVFDSCKMTAEQSIATQESAV